MPIEWRQLLTDITRIENLADVADATLIDGNFLIGNETAAGWKSTAISGDAVIDELGALTLGVASILGKGTITAIDGVADYLIVFDSSSVALKKVSAQHVGATNLSALTDVGVVNANSGTILIGDGDSYEEKSITGDIALNDTGLATVQGLGSSVDCTSHSVEIQLKDNTSSALKFSSTGAIGLLQLNTNDSGASVHVVGNATILGDLTLIGDLLIEGTTTEISTVNLEIEDMQIELGSGGTQGSAAVFDGAGFHVDFDNNQAKCPALTWAYNSGGGNTDGTATSDGLTGWALSNARTSNQGGAFVAVMDFDNTAPTTQTSQGIGSFYMDSVSGNLYVRTA